MAAILIVLDSNKINKAMFKDAQLFSFTYAQHTQFYEKFRFSQNIRFGWAFYQMLHFDHAFGHGK